MTTTDEINPPIFLLLDVMRYYRGIGRFDFSGMNESDRSIAALEAWKELEGKIMKELSECGFKL